MRFEDIKGFANQYETVCIYGSGELGKALFEALNDLGVAVSAFIVSDNQEMSSTQLFDIPILKLSHWLCSERNSNAGILVSVSKSYQSAIVKNLEEKNISDYLLVDSAALHESMRRLHPVKPERFLTDINPVSRGFGSERGKPIDRAYIEQFLYDTSRDLQSAQIILEVGSDAYSKQFFPNLASPEKYHVLQYGQGMDLTDVSTLPQNRYDIFLCTQVFNFIYDVKAAVRGAYYLLKPGGTLLATVQGCIGQVSRTDMKLWGDYWRFTNLGIEKLVGEIFGSDQVKVFPYGNAFAATAFVQGLAFEDISQKELLKPVEAEYAINIGVVAHKKR